MTKLEQELEKNKNRQERQKLSLVFSFLKGEDLEKYKNHTKKNGTSLKSLKDFEQILINDFFEKVAKNEMK